MSHKFSYGVVLLTAIVAAMCCIGCAKRQGPPTAKEPGGPPPSSLYYKRKPHAPPPLSGTGDTARQSTQSFIEWAGSSNVDEREDGRTVIAGAQNNDDVVRALYDELIEAQKKKNHGRALLVLAILGEMRNAQGEGLLRDFVRLPLPEKGTEVAGEIIEQTALAMLQAKAIDGLAYQHSASGDKEVLRVIAENPSRIVRAEAIDAYLWNHGDTAAARAAASRYVRKDETIFLDRLRREEGESAETFNRKLQAYLEAHPEVVPPEPVRANPPPSW
jgi:hypothetical protein